MQAESQLNAPFISVSPYILISFLPQSEFQLNSLREELEDAQDEAASEKATLEAELEKIREGMKRSQLELSEAQAAQLEWKKKAQSARKKAGEQAAAREEVLCYCLYL